MDKNIKIDWGLYAEDDFKKALELLRRWVDIRDKKVIISEISKVGAHVSGNENTVQNEIVQFGKLNTGAFELLLLLTFGKVRYKLITGDTIEIELK